MRTKWWWILILLGAIATISVGVTMGWQLYYSDDVPPVSSSSLDSAEPFRERKVLYINSYHFGYEWSDGILTGILQQFALPSLSIEPNEAFESREMQGTVLFKMVQMDTKRNKAEKAMKIAASRVMEVIEHWKPDLVIASDDNAVKYVVEEYLNGGPIPVIFCGVNWNLDNYQLRTDQNITGIIEVAHYVPLVDTLRKLASGSRVGMMEADNTSGRAEFPAASKMLRGNLVSQHMVNNFEEWKQAGGEMNKQVDIIIFNNNAGIKGWNAKEAREFVHNEIDVITGSVNSWMGDYNMVVFAKDAPEQGSWAASTALRILAGESPSKIPVATGKNIKVYLNMKLAKKGGVVFPMSLLERAHLINPAQ